MRTAKVSRWQEAVIKAESEGEKDKRGEQLLNFWAKLTRRAFFRFRDVRKREGLAEPLVWWERKREDIVLLTSLPIYNIHQPLHVSLSTHSSPVFFFLSFFFEPSKGSLSLCVLFLSFLCVTQQERAPLVLDLSKTAKPRWQRMWGSSLLTSTSLPPVFSRSPLLSLTITFAPFLFFWIVNLTCSSVHVSKIRGITRHWQVTTTTITEFLFANWCCFCYLFNKREYCHGSWILLCWVIEHSGTAVLRREDP